MNRFIGFAAILLFLGVAYLCSTNRRAIRWRTVAWGMSLQLFFAFAVLKLPAGQAALSTLAQFVSGLISYADEGGSFVFGWLASSKEPNSFVFAFKVLPIVVFASSLFSCLYYLGIMQWVIVKLARVMTRLMGISGCESVAAVANVFLGQTEAPLLVAPYVAAMTSSELLTVMTCGMATASGAVLGGYMGLGINPEYLISASVMAAPAAVVMAKILVPETGRPQTAGVVDLSGVPEEANLIDAAARGASRGAKLAFNIAAMLIAFVSLIYLANGISGAAGRLLGLEALVGKEVTLQLLLGYLLSPVMFLMGVPAQDVITAGQLVGVKTVLNEFVAYIDLVEIKATLHPKTELIATYALCGFANLGSIGVQIAGIGGLAPARRSELARFGLRAVLAGSLASLTSATVAGMLF